MAVNRKSYICLYDSETNTVMVCTKNVKNVENLKQYVTETTKAYKVLATSKENAVEVFKEKTGFDCEVTPIHYTRHYESVTEFEL